MATRLISPGVFTEENDLSFLPQGIAEIGAAFIGPFVKGPAFRPVIVDSQNDFEARFGGMTPDFYTPYAVRGYLKEAARATIVRILGLDGYDNATYKSIVITVSGSGTAAGIPAAVIHPSRTGITLATASISGTPLEFHLTLSGSNGSETFTSLSLDPEDTNYVGKVLGYSVVSAEDGYVYAEFPNALTFITGGAAGSGSVDLDLSTSYLMLSGSTYGTYRNAFTPWIRSQLFGATRFDLFKFHTLSDGNAANRDIKVSIASIRPDPLGTGYGTFSVLVRKFDDTDSRQNVLENFDNLNLDPDSANYIGKRIGTARPLVDSDGDVYLEGDYPNNSKYIYVELATGLENAPVGALPYGFAPLAAPINDVDVPAPDYIDTRYYTPAGSSTSVANNKVYYGFNFESETGLSYLNPIPSGSINAAGSVLKVGVHPSGAAGYASGGVDIGFDLNVHLAAADLVDLTPTSAFIYRKFTVPFQNGFDGQNPAVVRSTGGNITATNTMGFDLSDADASGARGYKQALDILDNTDEWDINLLVMPGVVYSQHPYIAQEGIDLCEERGDTFYIMDSDVLGATTATAVNTVESLDTNYAATYYPWVKVLDASSNKNIWVPPSVVLPAVYAFNDRVAAEWFAPAGLNRGGLTEALQVRKRLDLDDRDELYEGRVNPIAFFRAQGITVWGQKTLQVQASALDRINVRRLLIAVKKFIASTSRYLVFEQNVDATRQRFLSIVNPYLASVQERAGLYAFRVIMDETNNTPDIIDRNILVGQIYLQPTKTAEFISLEFNVLPTGASFEE